MVETEYSDLKARYLNGELDHGYHDPSVTVDKIHRDIPNLRWLNSEREYAREKFENGDNFRGTVTATFLGRLPVSMVSKLPGKNNEHTLPNVLHDFKSEPIRESIQKEGVKEPIMLWVGFNGQTVIAEGNHRTKLAEEFNQESIPVEIKYFAGGELVNGNFKLSNFDKETSQKYLDMEKEMEKLAEVA